MTDLMSFLSNYTITFSVVNIEALTMVANSCTSKIGEFPFIAICKEIAKNKRKLHFKFELQE